MDLSIINEYMIPIVVVACLIVGYCIKHISWLEKVGNEYIPTILAALGAVLGCIATGNVTLESVVFGAMSGLVSTGLHQAFSQIINKSESSENG